MVDERTAYWGDRDAARYRTRDDDPTGGDYVVAETLDANGDPVEVLLRWDDTAGEWVSGGPVNMSGADVTNVGSVDADSVSSGELIDGRQVARGGDVQNRLDENDKRSTLVYLPGDLGTATFSDTILLGEGSQLVGEHAIHTEQDAFDFTPRPVLEWDTATDAIASDPNASYRAQKPELESLDIVGTGDANGSAAVLLQNNSNGDAPGLTTITDVFIESYERGIDGAGQANTTTIEDSSIMKVNRGIANIKSAKIRGNYFYRFESGGGYAVRTDFGNWVHNNSFEMGLDSAESVFSGVIVGGDSCGIESNKFIHAMGFGVLVESGNVNNVIADNRFEFRAGDEIATPIKCESNATATITGNTIHCAITNFGIDVDSDSVIVGNDLSESAGADAAINLRGDRNLVAFNQFSGGNDDTVVVSGTENVLWGSFPTDPVDNGTRTIINGASTNAGSPNSEGQWNGNAGLARRLNVTIYDTSQGQIYLPSPAGTTPEFLRIDN